MRNASISLVITCFFAMVMLLPSGLFSQNNSTKNDSTKQQTDTYKKRVLETTEVDFLTSFYSQDGSNAAVTGGIGTEQLTDATGTFVISIPLSADEVLKIDAGISAYTSASSSNINPFDGGRQPDAFVASSGESRSDLWYNLTASYSHYSDDRNSIWSAKASFSNEFDYSSIGFGGSFTRLFNKKNTEIGLSANVYLDTWKRIYPVELGLPSEEDDEDFNINNFTITGAPYNPQVSPLPTASRNSYSGGLTFSQVLSRKMQGSLALDAIAQEGNLSTPFQRVYFADKANSYIQGFHLADDIERLPSTRLKVAIGGRLNYYINENVVARTFYRYYFDDWGITSHTASVELPVKLGSSWTIYPAYRFYNQTAADYFAPYDEHLSTSMFYTSDYDLSQYTANQYSLGFTYKDIFAKGHIWRLGIKSISLNYYYYQRNTGLTAHLISGGIKFVLDKKK
ncbi:MAG: DUF3570 domain-containing protein [Bacteroidia bacterium]